MQLRFPRSTETGSREREKERARSICAPNLSVLLSPEARPPTKWVVLSLHHPMWRIHGAMAPIQVCSRAQGWDPMSPEVHNASTATVS